MDTPRSIKIYRPRSWWEPVVSLLLTAPIAYVGVRRLHTAYPISFFLGLCAFIWWFGNTLPDYWLTSRQFVVGLRGRRTPVDDAVLVSDGDHKEVVVVNKKTGRASLVWEVESEDDRCAIEKMLRQGIKQEGTFAEQCPNRTVDPQRVNVRLGPPLDQNE